MVKSDYNLKVELTACGEKLDGGYERQVKVLEEEICHLLKCKRNKLEGKLVSLVLDLGFGSNVKAIENINVDYSRGKP